MRSCYSLFPKVPPPYISFTPFPSLAHLIPNYSTVLSKLGSSLICFVSSF